MKLFYVYLYLDRSKKLLSLVNGQELKGEAFYVGKGSGQRDLFIEGKNKFVQKRCKKIGKSLEIHKIECESEEIAFLLEKNLIASIGRKDKKEGPLLNLTDGGDGISGYSHSEKAKLKIAEAARKTHANVPKSEEHRRKISMFQKGKKYEEKMSLEKASKLREEKKKSYLERYGEEKASKIKEKQRIALKGKSRPEELMKRIAEKKKIKLSEEEVILLKALVEEHGSLNRKVRSHFKQYRYYVLTRTVESFTS